MPIYALCIIHIGAKRSVIELIKEYKKIKVDKKKSAEGEEGVETMQLSDVLQFPLYAGGMLTTLYFAMDYFGSDPVNYFILSYMALGCSQSVKALLLMLGVSKFDELESKKLFHLKISWMEIDMDVTPMDLLGLAGSGTAMYFYVVYKNWLLNNLIATLVSISGIQMCFLGNYKNGFLMLTGLFFYDIFFVFQTDVMLTVAKNINAPIKLLFPNDWSPEPTEDDPEPKPKFSLLGLGDVVIPGIYMAMCLRYDVVRHLNVRNINNLGENAAEECLARMRRSAVNAPKTYYLGCVVGYLLAIIATVMVMLFFDHGQPALLYLVPACLGSTTLIALAKGEFKALWEYSEECMVDDEMESEESEKDGDDTKKTK